MGRAGMGRVVLPSHTGSGWGTRDLLVSRLRAFARPHITSKSHI